MKADVHGHNDRFLREMSLEEGLIGGDIFDAYDVVGTDGNYFVYQLEWITMWK